MEWNNIFRFLFKKEKEKDKLPSPLPLGDEKFKEDKKKIKKYKFNNVIYNQKENKILNDNLFKGKGFKINLLSTKNKFIFLSGITDISPFARH